MKKLFIDTNILLDIMIKREPFVTHATKLINKSFISQTELFISSLSIANANYILSKMYSPKVSVELIKYFRDIFRILPLTSDIIDLALGDVEIQDFEDALQYYTAVQYFQDVIITRNKKDFTPSKIPVLTAEEFSTKL